MSRVSFRRLAFAVWAIGVVALAQGVSVGCSSVDEEADEDEESVGGCGVERWSVKTGTDQDVSKVSLNVSDTTVSTLAQLVAPKNLPANNRIAPTELQTLRMRNVTLQQFKLEADSDIHLILSDGTHTMNAEIPSPSCVGSASPFASKISATRTAFTAKFTPTSSFTNANIPISLVGVGFFDMPHGQRGGATNGTEIHPVLDICFGQDCTLTGGFGDGGTGDGGDAGSDGGGCDGGGGANLSAIQTVFVILLENHNWTGIKGSASAPYINGTLLPMGAHAENYLNLPGIHPSEPNYIWLESGDNLGIKDDGLPSANHQATTDHLVTYLEKAGISWKAYAEGASGTSCPVANSGLYAPKHVPFVFFDDVMNNASRCTQHVRPYTELASDLASGNVARYNFITPNLCDDMHNSTGCATSDSVKNGDTWLSQEVPRILGSAAFKANGALFVTFDESEGGDFPIAMIAVSPLAKPGYASTIQFTHSSTLRTMQEIFGVQPFLRAAATSNDLSDLFNLGGSSCGDGGAGDGGGGTDSGGGNDSGGGTDSGGGSDSGGTICLHDKCVTGNRLTSGCDPCVTQVCAKDSFCCTKNWDATCVKEVGSVCGQTCP